MNKKLATLGQFVHPRLKVGGIEVTDGALLYVYADRTAGTIQKASVRLEPGIVENGKLMQQDKFCERLRALHGQVTHRKTELLPVILSISDENVYMQRFTLPPLPPSEFKQAAALNAQTLSPIEFSSAYSDWERLPSEKEGEYEVLASFVERGLIDAFSGAFQKEHFFITAIEQKSLSLARVVIENEKNVDVQKSYLILSLNADGVSYSIIRKGSAIFTKHTPWKTLAGEHAKAEISEDDIVAFVSRELHQVQNFFANSFHDQFEAIYITAQAFENAMQKAVAQNFSLPVRRIQSPHPAFTEQWLFAVGAAERGQIPLSQDLQISLAPEGTESLYRNMQTSLFLAWWIRIGAAISFIILVSFLGSFLLLNSIVGRTAQSVSAAYADPSVISQFQFYGEQARNFNKQLEEAILLYSRQVRWDGFISTFYAAAGPDVLLDRVYIQSPSLPVSVNARAQSEQAAQAFKTRLAALPYVTDVDLPLAGIQRADGNLVSFRLSFRFSNLNF